MINSFVSKIYRDNEMIKEFEKQFTSEYHPDVY